MNVQWSPVTGLNFFCCCLFILIFGLANFKKMRLKMLHIYFLGLLFFVCDLVDSKSFKIDYANNTFVKDGEAFRYVSGSIHYFRSPEERWDALLKKMRLGGLNAITTYVAWNLHQPTPKDEYDFSGNLNIFKFLELAQKNDLLVILRTSPFIDAERDMGGLPAWLLFEKPKMLLRSSDLDYIYHVSHWYDELMPRLKPFLYSNGGPIITMQVENEYGSTSQCDGNYTLFLRDLIRYHLGNDLVLFTTDGPSERNMRCGAIPDVYSTVDFGPVSSTTINRYFAVQRLLEPKGPLVNSEFYPGWLDFWQKPHNKANASVVARALDDILSLGANVNIYMYHGGTSFGMTSGANLDDRYYPCPTSYDYDAPLTEAGDPTEKYFAIKERISKYMPVPPENPSVTPKGKYGKVLLHPYTGIHNPEFLTLFTRRSIKSSPPLSFESLKIGSGFVLYQTLITFKTSNPILLKTPNLRDRGYVYVNEELVGILSRTESIYEMPLMIEMGQTLSILVENQGRLSVGDAIGESKGLGNNITIGSTDLHSWTIFPLGEMDGDRLLKYSLGLKDKSLEIKEDRLKSIRNRGSGRFFAGNFTLPQKLSLKGNEAMNEGESGESEQDILDTYVRMDGFSKGLIWINGFNLGRYWPIVGPQETLYLPGTLLKPYPNANTIILFEHQQAPDGCFDRHKSDKCFITLTDVPNIDAPTPYTKVLTVDKFKH